LASTASGFRPPSGWRAMAMGNSGIPRARRSTSPRTLNRWVQTVTVGTPRRSSSTESWILHDVQDPQSPRPTIATWAEVVNSSMTSCLAAIDAEGLRWWTALVGNLIFLAEQLLQPGEENVAVGFTVPKEAHGFAPKIGWPWRHGVPQFSRRSGGVQTKMEPVAVAVIISLQSFRRAGTIYSWNTYRKRLFRRPSPVKGG